MAFDPNLLGIEKKPEIVPERVEAPETSDATVELEPTEPMPEQSAEAKEQEVRALKEAHEIAPASIPIPVAPKDPVLSDVENILSDGLGEIYMNLPEAKKPAFKKKGEEIAETTKHMVLSGRVKAKRILDLIRDWLKLIPGINRFFLEQEAKIKTDKIIDYAQVAIGKAQNQL